MTPFNISTVIIDDRSTDVQHLKTWIERYCPIIEVKGVASCLHGAEELIAEHQPELIFLEINLAPQEMCFEFLDGRFPRNYETIIVTEQRKYVFEATKYSICGYLLKPFKKRDLIITVNNARQRIGLRRDNEMIKKTVDIITQQLLEYRLVGIPTLKGFDFFCVDEIIRCEGMQRYTQVFSNTKREIVSSYNLGAFKKLLLPYGFYATHKSHLINLNQVRKYSREGTIIMNDNSRVPITSQKKKEFLSKLNHL